MKKSQSPKADPEQAEMAKLLKELAAIDREAEAFSRRIVSAIGDLAERERVAKIMAKVPEIHRAEAAALYARHRCQSIVDIIEAKTTKKEG